MAVKAEEEEEAVAVGVEGWGRERQGEVHVESGHYNPAPAAAGIQRWSLKPVGAWWWRVRPPSSYMLIL